MALREIKISEPYFKILSEKNINKNLRVLLIKQAPKEFYSVITQTARHLLNNNICAKIPDFCTRFENSLLLIALPSTCIKTKQKILISEPYNFISELFEILITAIEQK